MFSYNKPILLDNNTISIGVDFNGAADRMRFYRVFITVKANKTGLLPIPTKPPVYNGIMPPRDSWMMPPTVTE